ncbi:hypothetical protein ACHQM5_017776 [Ranunculus cassubicifolius]
MRSLENDDDDVIELEMNQSRKRRRPKERSDLDENVVDMADKDYADFLEMLKKNVDYYVESGEYCLDYSPRAEENVDDEIVDPDYKVFLDNVKEDGYSYVLELKKDDGTKVLLKYEAKDEDIEIDLYKDLHRYNGKDGGLELEPKIEPLDDGYGNVSACQVRKPVAATSFLSNCELGTFSCADETYLMFLEHVWVQGDCFIYKNGDVVVRYGDDDDDNVVSDSGKRGENVRSQGNGMRSRSNTNGGIHNMDVSEGDSDFVQILDDEGYDENKFTTELRKLLSKPFNRKELNDKLQAAEDHKPVKKLRVLRSCDKWCDPGTGQLGDSYLDQNCHLNQLLRSALSERVPQRALSLLRCLFFYYENMPQQGSFRPWVNPPTWLHNIICSCQEDDTNCPMTYDGSLD